MIFNLTKKTILSESPLLRWGKLPYCYYITNELLSAYDSIILSNIAFVIIFPKKEKITTILLDKNNKITNIIPLKIPITSKYSIGNKTIYIKAKRITFSSTNIGDILDLNAETYNSEVRNLKSNILLKHAHTSTLIEQKTKH